ncbi:beta-galactosidase [Desulfomicrobium baculatum]|uniref:beta-galactosidase n=1 Tax=Desulfomicrobium baculatum TaxID=899 RepID=UPI001427BFFA|nr:beta-galactosidase [Desulfomicrobium baculatum]
MNESKKYKMKFTKESLMLLLVSIIVSFYSSHASASGQNLKDLEIDHDLTLSFETPHTKWAKPYAGGRIKVLFFSSTENNTVRECVELIQRFDIECKAIFWTKISGDKKREINWHGGNLGRQRMTNLLKNKWDCFVFFGVSVSDLPAIQKEMVMNAVTRGAGLVSVEADNQKLRLKKNGELPISDFIVDENTRKATLLGKGREIVVSACPQLNFTEGWEITYDYWQESLGRAVLWAAQQEPMTRLRLDVTAGEAYSGQSREIQVGRPATLNADFSGKPFGTDHRIRISVRKPGHAARVLPEQSITFGATAVFKLPSLPEGIWRADAVVVGSLGVETWASQPFVVSSERTVTGLSVSKYWAEPGESISGKVFVSGVPLINEIVRIQLLDSRRRELVRQDIPANGNEVEFVFDIAKWMPMLVTVEARLLSNNVEISRTHRYVRVAKRQRDRFNFLIWGVPKGTLAPYAEESLARQGVTLQLDWENPPLHVAANDISWIPFTTHIPAEKKSNGVMKPFCWNDGLAVWKQTAMLASIHRRSREHGVFVYSIGDENKTKGSCISKFCTNTYQVFLQESYSTLDALNRSWGTDFERWKDVGLLNSTDDDELASLALKNYPRWFDRQAYKSWNYVQYCLKYSKAYKGIDPQAKTGFDGAAGFATGDDIDLIIRSLDSWVPYQSIADEVIRSIAPREFIRSNWIGGRDKTSGPLLYKYWRLVNLGADSIWWWMWSCIGDLRGFLAPDLRPFPEIEEVVEDTRMVRDGLGDLLLQSVMLDDDIAILYSYPSVFAHKLDEGASFGSYEEAHSSLIKFIRNSGYQFRYITDRMLRQSETDLSKFRMLFLPRAEAISDKEAELIRQYVAGGGTVVADLRPGLYDDHCKRREKGILDDMFGIKQAEKNKIFTLGQVIVRSVGKGRAILLNNKMSSLPALMAGETLIRDFWGGAPAIKIHGKMNGLEVTRWRNQGIEILSLLREGVEVEGVTVSLPKSKYIYDLRAFRSYGLTDHFDTNIIPNRASFFALTDRHIAQPVVSLHLSEARQGMMAQMVVEVPDAEGKHALKMGVKVDGNHVDWFDKVVLVGAEPVTVELPIAYNDPVGNYSIEFTDLFSGKKSQVKFNVSSFGQKELSQAD